MHSHSGTQVVSCSKKRQQGSMLYKAAVKSKHACTAVHDLTAALQQCSLLRCTAQHCTAPHSDMQCMSWNCMLKLPNYTSVSYKGARPFLSPDSSLVRLSGRFMLFKDFQTHLTQPCQGSRQPCLCWHSCIAQNESSDHNDLELSC